MDPLKVDLEQPFESKTKFECVYAQKSHAYKMFCSHTIHHFEILNMTYTRFRGYRLSNDRNVII